MTQQLGFNYGGIIQNYALQKVLTGLGHSVVTIDRGEENPHSKVKISLSRFKSLLLRYVFKQRTPIYLDYRRISTGNREFINRNIKLSRLKYTTSMLADYFRRKKIDAVIVGSDQVWRPSYSPDIYNFYLDFLSGQHDVKKIAYAASFGTEQWEYSESQTRKCGALIQQFHGVSAREDSGIELCSKYLNRKDVAHVVDPTFLLQAEDYSQLIGSAKKDIGLFTYVLDESTENLKFIAQCAQTLGLSIHTNQAKLPPDNVDIDNIQDYIIPPIKGWLQGFRDAEFIITDSFHGTVFSIINKKPFVVLVNNARGAARFESILKYLGLEDRLIGDLEGFDFSSLKSEINYETVNSKLKVLKTESLSFLTTNL